MDLKEIAQLIEIIDGADIEEFELERDGVRVRVRKGRTHLSSTGAQAPLPFTPATAAPTLVSGSQHGEAPSQESQEEDLHIFKAPIVGTFYIRAKPDAAPFVRPGDRIAAGTDLCLIEAMKIFNTIESDVEGEIVRILLENGQPVEYGEALFEIRIYS